MCDGRPGVAVTVFYVAQQEEERTTVFLADSRAVTKRIIFYSFFKTVDQSWQRSKREKKGLAKVIGRCSTVENILTLHCSVIYTIFECVELRLNRKNTDTTVT